MNAILARNLEIPRFLLAILIGPLLSSRWPLSIAAALGAFLLVIMSVISLFGASGSTTGPPVGTLMVVASVLMVFAVPAAAAAGGYAGSRVVPRRWW